MNRRTFMALVTSSIATNRTISALSTVAKNNAATTSGASVTHHAQKRPNVIFLICDDLGYGDLQCYGSQLPTPNLNTLAEEGMRFTRFNAAQPICSAARAALLTGRYGVRSGTTGAFHPDSKTGTALDETLLSNLYQASGYKTKAIGKWHLGDAPPYLPTSRGFDSYYGVPCSVDMYPLSLFRNLTVLEYDTDRDQLTPRYTEEAVRYIEESGEDPYFLYVAYSYPHDPARASQRFRGKTGFGDVGDSIAEIDWSVGEIARAVERKGQTANTLICFTSDHGPWYQGCPGPLRGRKASTFEGGFRVPFLARWPGRIVPGKTQDVWCSALDVLPTLSALCGLEPPAKPLDGIDISGILTGQGALPERKPLLYFSPMSDAGLDVHCIRKGDWKLRVAQATGGEIYTNDRTTQAHQSAWLERPELYNLARDPAESYDVAKTKPDVVVELLTNLEEQMPSFPADVVAAYAELKHRPGDISTPPGASPRPYKQPLEKGSWEPEDRRWASNL